MKIAVFFMIVFLLMTQLSTAGGLDVGTEAPNIVGRTMDGKLYRLSKDKAVPKVVNFFWYLCAPCKEEMPELASLEKKYPNIKFLAVHTEDIKKERVVGFLKEVGRVPSNIVLSNKRVKKQFKYLGLPHTIVLDSNNRVKLTLSGYTKANMAKLEKMLKTL